MDEYENFNVDKSDVYEWKRCQDSYIHAQEILYIRNNDEYALFIGYYVCERCDILYGDDIDCVGSCLLL